MVQMSLAVLQVAIVVAVFTQCAFAGDYTPEQKSRLVGQIKQCASKNGVSDETLKKIRGGAVIENDENVQKFILCAGVDVGFLNDKAEFQNRVISAEVPELTESETLAVLNKCSGEKGSTVHETAFLRYKCALENVPKPVFILTGSL